MKATGIVRRLDELGRFVLPAELRRTLDIDTSDSLEVYTEGEKIILLRYTPACIFCGEATGIRHFKGKNICPSCVASIADLASQPDESSEQPSRRRGDRRDA